MVLVVAPLAVFATACGASTPSATDPATAPASTPETTAPSDPASTPASNLPDCAAVWVKDAKLPAHYSGCMASDGSAQPALSLLCESGQKILRYDDHYWGVRTGTVKYSARPLAQSYSYAHDLAVCRG
jgi:hypothetical protein